MSHFDLVHAVAGTTPKIDDGALYHSFKTNSTLGAQDIFSPELGYDVIVFQSGKAMPSPDDYVFKSLDHDKITPLMQVIFQTQGKVVAWTAEKLGIEGELKVSQRELQTLRVQTGYVLEPYARQEAKKKSASTEHLVVSEDWVEAEQIDRLEPGTQAQLGDGVFIQELDVVEGDWENVSIKLKNYPLIESFGLMTGIYVLPKYYERDPTPILMPFYFTFFEMMAADLGYGLFLFLTTFSALGLSNLSEGTGRFSKLFNILAAVVSSWGIVYGSFFGHAILIVLLLTTVGMMTILPLSVTFGSATAVVGLLLGGLQKLWLEDYVESYNSGFAWCLILTGILLIVLGAMLPHLSVPTTIGVALAIVNATGTVAVSIIQAKSLVGLGSGLYNLCSISGYMGDLVSLTRLMALGLLGVSTDSALSLIVEISPSVVRFTIGTVIFIPLHTINVFSSLLSDYVYGARLMLVEFFGKFYEGGGEPFRPLKLSEEYVRVAVKPQLEEN